MAPPPMPLAYLILQSVMLQFHHALLYGLDYLILQSGRSMPSTCPPRFNCSCQNSNGHCAPTVKRDDRTRHSNDRTRRTHNAAHPRRIDRTCSTQRPDATEPMSDQTPVSTLRDRTRPIAYDRTRRASAQPFATHCSSGCPTRRSGPASDRTRRLQTLARAPDCCAVLTGRTGQTVTASGAASDHPGDLRSPPFLFRLPA
jgi:hypothetical protein